MTRNKESPAVRHTLHVCSTCLAKPDSIPNRGARTGKQGLELADAMRRVFIDAGLDDFDVKTVACMSMCDAPNAISFRATGKAAYLFSGVDPVTDRDDILAFAKLYTTSADGWIEDARPLGRLRFCLTGRIPA